MDNQQAEGLQDEVFFASGKSHTAKIRMWMWIGLIGGFAVSAATSSSGIALVYTGVLLLVAGGGMELFFRGQLKTDKPLVTLTTNFIESPGFPGKVKRIPWQDVIGVSLEPQQGVPMLQLQLVETADRPNKRSFLTGANSARPLINLAPISPEDQERLLDAINRRISDGNPWHKSEGQNDLLAEREFQEKLKALAPIPWVTYAVIGINVVVWSITVALGASPMQVTADKLLTWGGNAASEVQKGEWWRMLTATFLHGGLMHLTMNMIGLIGAGITVERLYGHRLYALIYLGSGLMGSAMSLNFAAQKSVSVGASGAVFGVAGALLAVVYKNRGQMPKIFGKQTLSGMGVFVLYSLVQGFANRGIDNAAHIGGLLGGCLLAYMLPDRLDLERFERQLVARSTAALASACIGVAGLAATAPPATHDLGRAIANGPVLEKSVRNFQAVMVVLQREVQDVNTGKMTPRESDERSRTVHAPVFRQVVSDFSQVYLLPGDPRETMVKDMKRMAELLQESLAMQSVFKEGSEKPEPADPVRMAAIEKEATEVGKRMVKFAEEAKAKQKH